MKALTTILLTLLVLGGCASTENVQIGLNSLKGSSINTAISFLGEPSSYLNLTNRHKYIWNHNAHISLPGGEYRYDSDGDRYYLPTDNDLDYDCEIEIYTDSDAVQEDFKQQRGNRDKGDKRKLVSDGVIPEPISGAKSINKINGSKSSFYGDE